MDELKKNQTHTAAITGYTSEGAGVCRILGRAVFVEGALKGELWEILILKVTASAVYGKGTKLLLYALTGIVTVLNIMLLFSALD